MKTLPKSLLLTLSLITLTLSQIIAHAFFHPPDLCPNKDPTHRTDADPSKCTEPTVPRGGSGSSLHRSQSIILDFLSSIENDGEFHIQGWRWHSLSLLRDARRMERAARRLLAASDPRDGDWEAAERAADYLVNFNMAGLHRVESKMLAGWLRDNLSEGGVGGFCENGSEVARALGAVIDEVEGGRRRSAGFGRDLYRKAKLISDKSKTPHQKRQHLDEIIHLSSQLSAQLQQTQSLQETYLVPSISSTVASSAQKSFNNRVLLKLGVLESRVHLVGMRDAVWEDGGEEEKEKFEREIPYVARVMIERWRRSLYEPKAGALDYGLS